MARKKPRKNTLTNSIHPISTIYKNKGTLSDDTDLTIVSISDNSRGNSPKPGENQFSEAVKASSSNLNNSLKDLPPSVVITESPHEETSLSSSIFSRSPSPGKLNAFNATGESLPVNGWKRVREVTKQQTIVRAFQLDSPSPKPNKKKPRQLSGTKNAIPLVPLPVAVGILILNIMVPGLGTMISGLTFLCGCEPYDENMRKNDDPEHKCGLICTNVIVGCAQLLTVTFLLVGWFWSISWGVLLVQLARDKRLDIQDNGSYISENP